MRLLVVSHACITPSNQGFFADVMKQTGWAIDLVIPEPWHSEYRRSLTVSRWKDFHGGIYPVPVWLAGNIPLHVYRRTMVGLLRRLRPDVIYVHHEAYGLATAQVYLANRMVDDCPIGFYSAQNLLKQYPMPFRWLESMVMQGSEFSFPVSEGALEVLRSKGYTAAAEVLPLPVDRQMYHPEREWATQRRAELGIDEDEFVVGYLGRLVEEKGLGVMLRAVAGLRGRWRCVLVGSGPYEETLRAMVPELGIADRVMFVGFVPHEEAPGWLTMFDVLVLASESRANWKEQFGRVIVEANACETTVIGTESGEIGNVLRVTGGGLVVAEGDVAGLGAGLQELMEDRAKNKALALHGAAAVRERYDQEVLAARFAATIDGVAPRRG
jgi:glycosyltransferase involved in cell wall biosynthesis